VLLLTFPQEFFSSNKEADKLRNVQKQVDEVKDIMMENIGARAFSVAFSCCG
jgi:hypothetical protein